MTDFYIATYILMVTFTILVPFYLAGRLWFAFSPFAINYYSKERANWYNDWNTQRFLIVLNLFLVSLSLSFFWGGKILEDIHAEKIDFTQILFYIILQILAVILFEVKMEHPFKPIQAFKKFKKNSYSERFEFREKQDAADKIEHHSNELKREFLKVGTKISNELNNQQIILSETNELAKHNNNILQESDFAFEIKKNPNMVIDDILRDYFISKDSERVLSDFLLRKKNSGKILFTKPARNGVSVQPILDFFSTFTNVMESCKSGTITQAETCKIINAVTSAKDRLGNIAEEPINSRNLSKYLSNSDVQDDI